MLWVSFKGFFFPFHFLLISFFCHLLTGHHSFFKIRYKNTLLQNVEITWTVSLACLLETLTAAGVSCRGGQSCKENYITTVIALSLCPHSTLWCFRCGQRWECKQGSVQGQWLWSFKQTQQCLSVHHLSFYNISRGEKSNVSNGWE